MSIVNLLKNRKREFKRNMESLESKLSDVDDEIATLEKKLQKARVRKQTITEDKTRLEKEQADEMKAVIEEATSPLAKRNRAGMEAKVDDDGEEDNESFDPTDADLRRRHELKLQVIQEFDNGTYDMLSKERLASIGRSGRLTRRWMDEKSGLRESMITKWLNGDTKGFRPASRKRCTITWYKWLGEQVDREIRIDMVNQGLIDAVEEGCVAVESGAVERD